MKSFVASNRVLQPSYWYVQDAPTDHAESQKLLLRYLDDARAKFKTELDLQLDTGRTFVEADRERLSIMLNLLVDARIIWQEEERSK